MIKLSNPRITLELPANTTATHARPGQVPGDLHDAAAALRARDAGDRSAIYIWGGEQHFLQRYPTGALVLVAHAEGPSETRDYPATSATWECFQVVDNPVYEPSPGSTIGVTIVPFDEFNVRRHGED